MSSSTQLWKDISFLVSGHHVHKLPVRGWMQKSNLKTGLLFCVLWHSVRSPSPTCFLGWRYLKFWVLWVLDSGYVLQVLDCPSVVLLDFSGQEDCGLLHEASHWNLGRAQLKNICFACRKSQVQCCISPGRASSRPPGVWRGMPNTVPSSFGECVSFSCSLAWWKKKGGTKRKCGYF